VAEESEYTAVENDKVSGLTVQARIQDAIERLDLTHKNFDRASRFLLVSRCSHTNHCQLSCLEPLSIQIKTYSCNATTANLH
jgi:hypothetical protein